MYTLSRIISCRIIPALSRQLFPHLQPPKSKVVFQVDANKVRKMSQKSITSFFKITPKKEKTEEVKQESPVEEKESASLEPAESPIKKQNGMKCKRQRLDSSDGEAAIANGSEKKKRVKRQRIESSGSESEAKSDTEPTPTQKTNSSVKTKDSPKNKKSKAKQISPVNKSKSPKVKVKEETRTPEKEETSERSVQNGEVLQDKSPTPKKEVKEITIKNKKDSKKEIKSEEKVKEEVKGDGGKVAELDYNPLKAQYHPVRDACWSLGQAVPYLALARTLELVEATSARLRIVQALANYLRSVIALTPHDLLPSVYLCLNKLAPAYHGLELGIAESYLMKAVGQCTGRSLAQVKASAAKLGDLGAAAEAARASQKTMFALAPLTVGKVFAALKEVAHMTGQASVNKKIAKIQSLYVACRHSEARYLIRSLEGKLRVGLAEQSVLQALALAATLTPPRGHVLDAEGVAPEHFKKMVEENALILKTTYCECPDYGRVIPVLLQHGLRALPQHCRLEPGTPLRPMLAQPARGLRDVLHRFDGEEFTCEWKYDGERAQIHVPQLEGGDGPDLDRAAVFSRNQEDNTSKYPDIVRRLPTLLSESVKSCVLDCEAVAYDVDSRQILPFQVLSTRKRKAAAESEIKVQVCVFVFDLLFLNGRALVREPLSERRELLREHFREKEGEWQWATSKDCSAPEQIQEFLDAAVKGSCEGLMLKTLRGARAHYDIARRSTNWLKLKKDYIEGVGDSLDVVVIGAYHGKGKRAGGFGGFLLACYDPDEEQFQSLCKIGTGFSDEDLKRFTAQLQEHVIEAPRSYYSVDPSLSPDSWLAPSAVWEIRCADLSLSPAHRAAAGRVDAHRGVSLRFPRFVRERDDKTPEQATSAQQIAEMYLAQDQVKNTAGNRQAQEDDFY